MNSRELAQDTRYKSTEKARLTPVMHVDEDVVPHAGLHHTLTDALELLGPAAGANLPLFKIKQAKVHLPLGHHWDK